MSETLASSTEAIRARMEYHRDDLRLNEPAEKGMAVRIAKSAARGGFPTSWVLAAIDDVADDCAVRRMSGEEPGFREVLGQLIRWTRRPRKPITVQDRLAGEGEAPKRYYSRTDDLERDKERAKLREQSAFSPQRAGDLLAGLTKKDA